MAKKNTEMSDSQKHSFVLAQRLMQIHYNELLKSAKEAESNMNIKLLTSRLKSAVGNYEYQLSIAIKSTPIQPVNESYWQKIESAASNLTEALEAHKRDARTNALEERKFSLTKTQVFGSLIVPTIVTIVVNLVTNSCTRSSDYKDLKASIDEINKKLPAKMEPQVSQNPEVKAEVPKAEPQIQPVESK